MGPPSHLIPYILPHGPTYTGVMAVWSSSVQAQRMSLLLPRTHSLHPLDLVAPTALAQALAARRSLCGRRGRGHGARRRALRAVQNGRLSSHQLPRSSVVQPADGHPVSVPKPAAAYKCRHFQANTLAKTDPRDELALLRNGPLAVGNERNDGAGG